MATPAAQQLYPEKSEKELKEMQENLEEVRTETPITGTPFKIGKHGNGFHLIMGTWKINDEAMENENQVLTYLETEKWNIMMRVAGCVVYDMVKPLVVAEALKAQGAHINKPIQTHLS